MEKTTNLPADDAVTKAHYSVERTHLHDFGYARAGHVQGDPAVYNSYLDRILNGDLVPENHKGLSEQEKTQKREKIHELNQFLERTKANNAKFEQDIKTKERQIEEHRDEILNLRKKHADNPEEQSSESFSVLKFSINLLILVFLSGYLFFFYVSAAYKALYVDFEGIAGRLAEGISTGSIMPGPAELSEALRYNYLLFLVPFVFYAFGWAFHILLDLKGRIKIVFISLLIVITFVVDLLIALIIHMNTESAKELMGLATQKWSANPSFYIILFLGFLVYIIWSILLDSLIREWKKRQITANLKKIIKHLKQDIRLLDRKLMPEDLVEKEIDKLQEQVNTYVEGNLKGYIDQFTTGWISYLTPNSMKEVRNQCLGIKEEFLSRHNIQAGVVKVMKPVRKIKI